MRSAPQPASASQRAQPRLRVALLSPCFWPEVRRGTERFVRELADGLIVRGHRPRVITSHRGLPRRAVEEGLEILRLPRPPQRPLTSRNYELYLTHVPFSYAALCAGSYDVAHSVFPADAAAAIRWKRRSGGPALLSYMGIPEEEDLGRRRKRRELLLRALRDCDAVVALSRFARDAFRETFGYVATVIPPGVDLETFRPLDARSPQPTIVCSAAAYEPRKQVGLLVRAFAELRRELPDARLVLSRPRRLQDAARAGVEIDAPGVEWANLDDDRALARAYAEAWVAVLPSTNEAFGLVLVEAMACGTPVVGFAHSAIPEVIDSPQLGRLFDRPDPRLLAQTILETIELGQDPATAAACRERASEFSVDRCTERYLSLYAELGAGVG